MLWHGYDAFPDRLTYFLLGQAQIEPAAGQSSAIKLPIL